MLHIFRQVLYGTGNQGNHQNFENSLLFYKFTLYCTKYCSRLYFLKLPSVYSWIFQSKKSVRRYAGMLFTIHWFFNFLQKSNKLELTDQSWFHENWDQNQWENLRIHVKFIFTLQVHEASPTPYRAQCSTMHRKLSICSNVQEK